MSSHPTETPAAPASKAPGPTILGRWHVPFFYGWVIVAVCYLGDFFASGLGQSTLSLFYKPMQNELGWSLSRLVGATTAATLGGMCISPFLGRAIDRFGVKPVMLWGTVVAGTGMLLMMFVQEVWQYWLLWSCIAALGLAEFAGLASQSAVSNWFIRRRGRAIMVSTLGNTTGTIVGAPVVAFLITVLGWRPAFGVMGLAIMTVLIPLIVIFIRNKPEDVGLVPDGDWTPTGKGVSASRAMPATEESWTLREALRTRTLWALMGCFVFGGSTIALNGSVLAPYLIQDHGMTAQQVGWVISLFWIPASVSRVIWGLLVDKLPARVCLFTVAATRACGPFCLALLPFPYNLGMWMLFGGLLGNAFGILQPVMFGNFFGRKSFATIAGGVRPLMALPGLAIPLILARLYDLTGVFVWGFLLSGTIGMMGALFALFVVTPQRPQPVTTATPQSSR